MGKGKIIFIEEYRQQRCLAALLADIGLPRYCDECGDEVSAMLLAGEATETPAAATAQIIPFPTIFAEAAEKREAGRRTSSRRAQARRSHRE
ncbi:MAG TPA: hypothetical protein VKB76_03840 [Ktedonobacterales bacterium]|nr:hypothetical protein [Ktedonobacterales bacterium]